MIIVQLDENKYFTGIYATVGSVPNGVEVQNLPFDLSNHRATCWKLCKETYQEIVQIPITGDDGTVTYKSNSVEKAKLTWVFDDEKYKKILDELSAIVPPKTQAEINEELISKNQEIADTIDMIMTEIIPSITDVPL